MLFMFIALYVTTNFAILWMAPDKVDKDKVTNKIAE